jgi:hypothetical protein
VFDFLSENIFFLAIAAVFIGIRILSARRKQQEEDAPPPIQIEEDEPLPPAPVKKKKPKAPKAAVPGFAAAITPTVPAPDSQRPSSLPRYRAEFSDKPFPENLDYLPPLQRALALSEILGPPKSLD